MGSENTTNYSVPDPEGGQTEGTNGDTGSIDDSNCSQVMLQVGDQSKVPPGDTESIGDPNYLRRVMLLMRRLGNHLMQVQLGDEMWKTTCKPMAQFIVQWGIAVLMFIFREACFGGKPHANWVYISLMLIQLVVLFSVTHSLIALGFSTIVTSKKLCWLVLLSLFWLMIGIIVGVVTSTILMANAYLASLP